MANHKSAKKRARQNIVRSTRNKSRLSSTRTTEKKLRAAIDKKDKKDALELLNRYESKIDRAAMRGIYHLKTASRKVGRLAKQVASL